MSWCSKRENLEDVTKILVETALGHEKADLVVKNATLVNVDSGELLENTGIAVKSSRIVFVGNVNHTIGTNTNVVDAKGKYLAPGFLDGHVHVESSMLTLTQFARLVLVHGTTTVFIDPHEIANVLGLKGIRLMMDEAKNLPLKVFICVPSCVPAAPSFETSGAELTSSHVAEALKWKGVIGLGEVMDYAGVLSGNEKVHAEIKAALKIGRVVEGHSDGLVGKELAAYRAAGISSCHEASKLEEGIERLRMGMCLMIREASAWRNLTELIKCVTELKMDSRHIVLVTDDRDVLTLVGHGHMDDVVRKAIQEGVDPVKAFQMATLNTAEHFGLDHEIGSLAPSKIADMVILEDLEKVKVKTVIVDGTVVVENGKLLFNLASPSYPSFALNTFKLKKLVSAKDFAVKSSLQNGQVKVRVIGVSEGKALTERLEETLDVVEGVVKANVEKDILKLAVVERHRATGNIGLGFVKGFGLREGALASSVAHDSHNIIVVGTNDQDMAYATNTLAQMGGGLIAVRNNDVLEFVNLPIAGLMSNEPYETVYLKAKRLIEATNKLGSKLKSTFMTLSLLALPVIPKLRLTDLGLIDVEKQEFVSLLVE